MSWLIRTIEFLAEIQVELYKFPPKERPLLFLVGLIFLYYLFNVIFAGLHIPFAGIIGYFIEFVYILLWINPLVEAMPKNKGGG